MPIYNCRVFEHFEENPGVKGSYVLGGRKGLAYFTLLGGKVSGNLSLSCPWLLLFIIFGVQEMREFFNRRLWILVLLVPKSTMLLETQFWPGEISSLTAKIEIYAESGVFLTVS